MELKERNEKIVQQIFNMEMALRATNNNNANNKSNLNTAMSKTQQQFLLTNSVTTTSSGPPPLASQVMISDIFGQQRHQFLENKNATPLLTPFLNSNFSQKFPPSNNEDALEEVKNIHPAELSENNLSNNLQFDACTYSENSPCINIALSDAQSSPLNNTISINENSQFHLTAKILQATSTTNNTFCKRSLLPHQQNKKDNICPCMSCILSHNGSSSKSSLSSNISTTSLLTGATRRKPCAAQIRKMSDSLIDEDFKSNI